MSLSIRYCIFKKMKKLTQEQAILRAIDVWGDTYDLSLFKYVNSRSIAKVICRIHGEFEIKVNNFLNGHGCPKCGHNSINVKKHILQMAKTTDDFIAEASIVHQNKYDYSKTQYKNSHTKVCIICHNIDEKTGAEHGEFWQEPSNHLNGNGCPRCNSQNISLRRATPYDNFVFKANSVHCNKYLYPTNEYKTGSNVKIGIICPKHGLFYQRASAHIAGQGCPQCTESKGEKRIADWLEINNINYIYQYKINLPAILFSKNIIWVDFYLPNHNIIIEYNGEQHYRRCNHWHRTEDEFRDQLCRDKRLREYCKTNKIRLIEIPYTEIDKIEVYLKSKIK